MLVVNLKSVYVDIIYNRKEKNKVVAVDYLNNPNLGARFFLLGPFGGLNDGTLVGR